MGNNICLVCTRYGRSQNLTSDFDLHLDTFHSLPTLIHQWWLGEVYGSIERNTYPGNKAVKLVTCGQILFMGGGGNTIQWQYTVFSSKRRLHHDGSIGNLQGSAVYVSSTVKALFKTVIKL